MIEIRKLANGLTVVVQPMPWLRTAAYTMWMPSGIAAEVRENSQDPDDSRAGLASLTCEMAQRGAGNYSSRELVAAEDELGVDRGGSASTSVSSLSASMPAESIVDALSLLADIVRRPHLPGDQFDDAKSMMRQEMMACQDEPTQLLMKRLRERQYGPQLGRSGLASEASLDALGPADVREFYERHFHAGDAILSVAGNVSTSAVIQTAGELFESWKSGESQPLPIPAPIDGSEHIESDSAQTHIGFAFDALPYGHEDYFPMRAGVGILSDGMSSRLFDRVREQRGLCYTVSAGCHSLKHTGSVFGYAGTTPPRAQETLDVTLKEIRQLAADLLPDELQRWKTRCESGLIMEQESARSRASSLASDLFQLGEVIPTERLEAMIQAITLDQVRDYWTRHAPQSFRIVILGPESLHV